MIITAIDIGNTNIVVNTHDGHNWGTEKRVKTSDAHAVNTLIGYLKGLVTEKVVVSSVVPNLTGSIKAAVFETLGIRPFIVDVGIESGLDKSSIPSELGSDLLCNMIHAHHSYPYSYVTVADFGTAFTTSTVSPEGKCMGVTIAPGMMTSVKALFQNTAQLPQIRLDLPKSVLGRDSVSSIRAGVLYGFCGQLEVIVRQIEKEIGHKVILVATGGFSKYIKPFLDRVDCTDTNFTLEGARLACLMNL